MNLFDPLRPKLPNGTLTWLRNHIAIPSFDLYPISNTQLELSFWLPIPNENFISKRFRKTINLSDFSKLYTEFVQDPELFCEKIFSDSPDDLKPQLRDNIRFEISDDEPIQNKKQKQKIKTAKVEEFVF